MLLGVALTIATACDDRRIEPTLPSEPRPSALIADLDDQPSPYNPGFVADLAVATALTVPLTQPVWDAETQQWITAVNTGAPGEFVHVEAGYNPRGSARVLVSGSGGAEGESVPVAGLLRGTTMQQQGANGVVLASDEPGAILGARSPQEWFDANPVTGTPAALPPALPLLGSVVLSDSAWRAARMGANENIRAEDHGERRVLARRTGALQARSTYASVRGERSRQAAWVLAHVELQLDHGGPRPATADIEIRRLAVRSNAPGNTRTVVTEEYAVGDVVPGRIVPPDDEPDPPPPDPAPPVPPGQPPAPTPPTWPNGVAPVVFQHGFGSSGATWTLMRDRLRPGLSMRDVAWTIATPGVALGTAADQFAANRDAFSPTPVAVVAHSAGGIIARDAARRQPGSIAGLVTVGTPHTGALLADRGNAVAIAMGATIIAQAFAISPCVRDAILRVGSFTCEALGFLGVMGGTLLASLGVAGDNVFPRDDLKPGSGFLDTLAQTPENYLRVGITHRVPRRWSFARLAGENFEAAATWNDPSAENAASRVSQVHRLAVFSMINAMVSIWALDAITSNQFSMGVAGDCGPFYTRNIDCLTRPRLDPFASQWLGHWRTYLTHVLQASLGIMVVLNAADGFYNWAVANGRDSDSFIATASQQYPNVPGSPFPPENRETDRRSQNGPLPAHNGETRSDMTRPVLRTVLIDVFRVREQPQAP